MLPLGSKAETRSIPRAVECPEKLGFLKRRKGVLELDVKRYLEPNMRSLRANS
jgi:hypothetical protein